MLDSMSQSEQIREDKTMLSLGLDVLSSSLTKGSGDGIDTCALTVDRAAMTTAMTAFHQNLIVDGLRKQKSEALD